jgi:hypothetical protein
VQGERLLVDPVELELVEAGDRGGHPLQVVVPGSGRLGGRQRIGVEQVADAAHRHAPFHERQDAADALHMLMGVQAVAFRRALGTDQPVAPLPGTQGHWLHPGERRDHPDRKTFDRSVTHV